MYKKADEIIKQPNFVKYTLESKIRPHFTHPDATRPLMEYIRMNYGVEPEDVESAEYIFLDPGGMVFTEEKSPALKFFVDNIGFSVKPEHIVNVAQLLSNRRSLANNPTFSKAYMAYNIVVLPEEMFEKVLQELYNFGEEAMKATREMEQGLLELEEAGHLVRPRPQLDDIESNNLIDELVRLANLLDEDGCHKEADTVDSLLEKVAGSGWGGMAQGKEAGYSVDEGGRIYHRKSPGANKELLWEPGDAVPDWMYDVPLLRYFLPAQTR